MMNATTKRFRRFAVLFAVTWALLAQEGHPLVGSWHGTWGPNAKDRTDVTVIFNWDGTSITGIVNPGLDAMKFQNASLDPASWTVHFETDGKDRSGSKVHVAVEGKIQDITNVRRSIVGTWTQGSVKGDFKITRDN
jgi:hypothetical protein